MPASLTPRPRSRSNGRGLLDGPIGAAKDVSKEAWASRARPHGLSCDHGNSTVVHRHSVREQILDVDIVPDADDVTVLPP